MKNVSRTAAGLVVMTTLGCSLFPAREKLWGPAFHLALEGDRAYVCAGKSLLILDMKEPRRPALIRQVDFPDITTRVAIKGTSAIVEVSNHGRRLADISDLARPVESAFPPEQAGDDERPGEVGLSPFVYLNDTCRFYVLNRHPSGVWDPAVIPAAEAVVGQVVLDPACNVRGRSALFVHPPLAYVAFERHMYAYRLGVLDVSHPEQPALLGECPIGDSVHHLPRTVVASGGFVYIAATLAGVIIVDVTDPERPEVAARFKTSTQ